MHQFKKSKFLASLAIALLASVMFSFSAACANEQTEIIPSSAYSHPQRLVSVDGPRRINLFCMGHGTPIVIFDAGTGGSTVSWRDVQARVAKTTTACSYDRAGYGFSDPSTRTSDASNAVDDLHRLVDRAKLSLPFILVGHSNGGIYASLYARIYPDQVAGLVLVDPGFAGQQHFERYGLPPQKVTELRAANARFVSDAQTCVNLTRSNALKDSGNEDSSCLDNPRNPDIVLHDALNREEATAAYHESRLSEFENTFGSKSGENVNDSEAYFEANQFGNKPLIVLTASRHPAPADDFTSEDQARYYAFWKRAHDAIAMLSSNGQSIVVPNTGHFIQRDQPEQLLQYVDEIIAKVRKADIPPKTPSPQ